MTSLSLEREGSFHTDFNASAYVRHHYGTPLEADKEIYKFVIATIGAQLGSEFGSRDRLFETGNGGVMRTAALGEPLLAPGATVTLTDIGGKLQEESQLPTIQSTIDTARKGDVGYWAAHQEAMQSTDKRWGNAITRLLCDYPIEVVPHDISKNPVPRAGVRVEGHVLCSRTDNWEDYWHSVQNFYRSMEPGDVAIRVFDVESRGYMVDGYRFKGFPINEGNIRSEATALGLMVLGVYETPVDTSKINTTTASTFDAIGGAVLLKPFDAISYVS